MGGNEEGGTRLLVVPSNRARGNGRRLTALTVDEFSRGVSILGDIQKPSKCGLGQLVLGVPA